MSENRDRDIEIVAKGTGVPADVLRGYAGDDLIGYADGIRGHFKAEGTAPVLPNDGNHAGTGPVTRDSILSIPDPAKRREAIRQNIDLF